VLILWYFLGGFRVGRQLNFYTLKPEIPGRSMIVEAEGVEGGAAGQGLGGG
jgi:hypothetical protein